MKFKDGVSYHPQRCDIQARSYEFDGPDEFLPVHVVRNPSPDLPSSDSHLLDQPSCVELLVGVGNIDEGPDIALGAIVPSQLVNIKISESR